MKLILATESQAVALALQSIKSVTGEAKESSCSKYLQRDTVVGFAELHVCIERARGWVLSPSAARL